MNKIIIVGHPLSGFEKVESLLVSCGMSQAFPSRRDGLTPIEITDTICKVNGVLSLDKIQSIDQLKQVNVSSLWQGMALDLMLGNINQALWGWSDSQVIYLLEYWKSLDLKIVFVLVYDTLESIITQLESSGFLGKEDLEYRVNSWVAYNSALLDFYTKNKECSVLVHSQQVHKSVKKYVKEISERIDEPLNEPLLLVNTDTELNLLQSSEITEIGIDDQLMIHNDVEYKANNEKDLSTYLNNQILHSYPKALELYGALQKVANLPLIESQSLPDIDVLTGAWASFLHNKQIMQELERTLFDFQNNIEKMQKQFIDLNNQKAELEILSKQRHELLNQKNNELKDLQQADKKNIENAEQMQKQLNELRDQKNMIESLNKQRQEQLDGKQREFKEIQQKNEALKGVQDENKMLLDQLFLVQEELARHLVSGKPSQVKEKPLFGAVDRIKNDLSYKLGATMIEHSHDFKGVLTLPMALYTETKQFRSNEVSLPPLEKYQDKHEAEKLKGHLSYKLGEAVLQYSKTPLHLAVLPFVLSKEAFLFQVNKNRKKLVRR